jgi:hypothetical protein
MVEDRAAVLDGVAQHLEQIILVYLQPVDAGVGKALEVELEEVWRSSDRADAIDTTMRNGSESVPGLCRVSGQRRSMT